MGVRILPWLKADVRRGIDCFGADFFPNGATQLKVYRRHPFHLRRIRESHIRARCRALSQEYPVRHLMFLKRVNGRGGVALPAKTILRLEQGIPGEQIAGVPALASYRRFLSKLSPSLTGQIVWCVCFQGNGMEIYFRKSLAPWRQAGVREAVG